MALLSDVLADVGGIVFQDTTQPTGTDLQVWTSYVNQSIREWGEAYEWKQLRVVRYAPSITLSQTSIGLPSNFEKLMSRPFNMALTSANDYEEIRGEDAYLKLINDSSQRYCIAGGNDVSGKYLLINPALPSGASLLFDYQMSPSLVSNGVDTIICPSENFVVQRVLSKIFQARADARFQVFQEEADRSMDQMIVEEATFSGATSNQTRNQYTTEGFRIGE